MMSNVNEAYRCCRPIERSAACSVTKRKITDAQINLIREKLRKVVNESAVICGGCRLAIWRTSTELHTESVVAASPDSSSNSTSSNVSERAATPVDAIEPLVFEDAIISLNKSITTMNSTISPIIERKIRCQANYSKRKNKEVCQVISEQLFNMQTTSNVEKQNNNDDREIIQQLKHKFSISTSKKEKYLILTTLPISWSIRDVEKEFNVTHHMAARSKELVKDKGIMSYPGIKRGHNLPIATINAVSEFFDSDENSRQMPGRADCVSIKMPDGTRQNKTKRLLLCGLKEAYQNFKGSYSDEKIGFSKFAQLKPKYVVLPGSSGTHTICVCIIHENLKLMLSSINYGGIPMHYSECISKVCCPLPSELCHSLQCLDCPGVQKLLDEMTKILEDEEVDEITFSQWNSTDRCQLNSRIEKPVHEFLEDFGNMLLKVIPHEYIAKQQSSYLKNLRCSLAPGHFIIQMDFSENYTFSLQNEVQSYHWNRQQATVHPCVVYYLNQHFSLVIISEELTHDATAVYICITKLLNTLKLKFGSEQISKIYYFSDGAGGQYKNKFNLINLCNHRKDFGVEAEWHFFATAHGKGPCDGIGGTIKRSVYKKNLTLSTDNQITNAKQMFELCKTLHPSMAFDYYTKEDYNNMSAKNQHRYQIAKTIPGTQKHHAFIPLNQKKIKIKFVSNSPEQQIVKIC